MTEPQQHVPYNVEVGMDDQPDLVTWLRAQLDADERDAPSEHLNPDEGGYYSCPATRTEPYGDLPYGEDACDCMLAERRRRVLDEVDAKRRIITAIHDRKTWRSDPPAEFIDLDLESRVLELLALPYAKKEGYRPEWTGIARGGVHDQTLG